MKEKNVIIAIKRVFRDKSDSFMFWYFKGKDDPLRLIHMQWTTDIEQAFVCNNENTFLSQFLPNTRFDDGSMLSAIDTIEWIRTDREETKHESNGWKQQINWVK